MLLATKLLTPRPVRASIGRPRLEGLLDEGLAKRLTLVAAPAGFGKTTLLAAWAASLPPTGPAVAWVSLDTDDNDPLRFWAHVLTALERQLPGSARQALARLQSAEGPPLREALTLTINALAESERACALILDDYHMVAEPSIHAALGFLLEGLPRQLHVTLATRGAPPLPLAKLRASAAIQELDAAALRCTADEAAAFLGDVMGLRLAPELLATVVARTEGWLVGLQLIGLWLQRGGSAGALAGLGGSQRSIRDYFSEQVLAQRPEPLRRFLLATSILDELCADLCAAVLDEPAAPVAQGRPHQGVQELLETIERENLFVVALDGEGLWYRYHALFAEAMRFQLERADPEVAPTLHLRASRWYAASGRPYEAMRHALQARAWAWAGDLAQEAMNFSLSRPGEMPTLIRWIGQLPDEVVHARPLLFQAHVGLLILSMRYDEAHRLLDGLERASHAPAGAPPPGLLALQAWADAIRAGLYAGFGQVAEAAELLARARRQVAVDDAYGQATSATAQAYLLEAQGLPLEALQAQRTAVERYREAGRMQPALFALVGASEQLCLAGRLDEAWQAAQAALDRAATPDGAPSAMSATALVAQAAVLHARGRLDEGLALAHRAVDLAETVGYPHVLPAALAQLLALHLTRQDLTGAAAALDRLVCSRTLAENHYRRSLLLLPGQVRLWLAGGEVARAAAWADGLVGGARQAAPLAYDYEETARARVAIAVGDPQAALMLLDELLPRARRQGRAGHAIELLLLRARALSMGRDLDAALANLAEAVRLGAPEGYVSCFLDQGPQIAALLQTLDATASGPRDRLHAYRAQLLAALELRAGASGTPAGAAGPVSAAVASRPTLDPHALVLHEPLTAREREVLQRLARGETNKTIAAGLVVAPSTVKNHLSRIFGKLAVRNRTEAVARAHELGLLEPPLRSP